MPLPDPSSPGSGHPLRTATGPRTAVVWRPWLLSGLIGLGLAVFGVHQWLWQFLGDDAYISFRYANQWVELGGPRFNPEPWPPVEGYTNPLWVAALALGVKLGISPPALAPHLTRAGSVLGIIVICGFFLRSIDRALPGMIRSSRRLAVASLPAWILLTSPEFMVWAHGGLEGSWTAALGVFACLCWARGRTIMSALCAALTLALRLDAGVWMAAYVLVDLLVTRGRGRIENLRSLAIGLGLGLSLVGGIFLLRFNYYGAWLPNTWAVKSHGTLLRDVWGRAYFLSWVEQTHAWLLVFGLPWLRPRHLPVLALMVANLFWGYWVGGDFMAYHRFYVPATMALAWLLPWLWLEMGHAVPRLKRLPIALVVGLSLWSFVTIPGRWQRDRDEDWLDKRWESVTAMHRFAAIRVAAGRRMASKVPSDSLVSVGAAGAFPYASNLPALDSYGLVAPQWVADVKVRTGKGSRPGHQVYAPLSRILEDDPDLLCHIGWSARRRPGPKDLRRRIGRRRGFDWLCVETGSIADHRAPRGQWPSYNYCCIAPTAFIAGLDQDERGAS